MLISVFDFVVVVVVMLLLSGVGRPRNFLSTCS